MITDEELNKMTIEQLRQKVKDYDRIKGRYSS